MTWLPWLIRAVGPLVVLAGLVRAFAVVSRRRRRIKVRGRITGYEHHLNSSNPIVEFRTQSGEVVSRRVAAVDLGIYVTRDVWVWYDPANPQRFEADVSPLGKPGCVPIAVGLVLIVLGAWFVGDLSF